MSPWSWASLLIGSCMRQGSAEWVPPSVCAKTTARHDCSAICAGLQTDRRSTVYIPIADEMEETQGRGNLGWGSSEGTLPSKRKITQLSAGEATSEWAPRDCQSEQILRVERQARQTGRRTRLSLTSFPDISSRWV